MNSSVDTSVSDNTGTHYKNRYTYLYLPRTKATPAVPEVKDAQGNITTPGVPAKADSGVGAFFRLGGYSDEEQTQTTNQSGFYPAKHISDEGGDGAASVYEKAAGPDASTSHGILLACDGRILVKAAERMYVESGAFHQKTNGTHNLHSTEELKIASDKQMTFETASGQEIHLNAGGAGGTAKFVKNSSDDTETINGNKFTLTTGTTRLLHRGAKELYLFGGSLSVNLAGSFGFTLGVDLTIKVGLFFAINASGSFTVSAFSLSFTQWSFAATYYSVNMYTGKVEVKGVDQSVTAAETETVAARASSTAVEADTVATRARSNAVTAETGGVKSMIAFWENKIANANTM